MHYNNKTIIIVKCLYELQEHLGTQQLVNCSTPKCTHVHAVVELVNVIIKSGSS